MTDPTPADIPSLVAELREESRSLQSAAWSRSDGGQDCSISAALADKTADALETLLDALSLKEDAFAGAGKPIGEDAVGGGEPCGGCGATSNSQRCIGCMHDFGTPESAWVRAHTPSTPAVEGIPAGMVGEDL